MFVDFGKTLVNLSEKVPGGILIFFPSYKLMDNCYEIWQDKSLI
jgi:Rad3-related DNA helicase